MSKLVACVNVFNEAELLPRVLEASLPFFDEFIIAEGAYINRWPRHRSTDGTLEVLERFEAEAGKPVRVITREGYWPSEVYKRNWMLRLVEPGDWYFYMDADWMPVWKPEARDRLLSVEDDYCSAVVYVIRRWMPTHFNSEGKAVPDVFTYPYFACFKNQPGLHYVYNHCTVADESGRYIHQRSDWKVHSDVGILYDELFRTDFYPKIHIKKEKFRQGVIVELSSGTGGFRCNTCGYGLTNLDERGRSRGFRVERGMPQLCPRCSSGDLAAVQKNAP